MREIKTRAELQEMIREAAELCEDCQECEFGEIVPQSADTTGCNWSVSAARGEGRLACMTCLQPAISELRKEYNLIDQRYTEALVERGLARAQSRAGDSKFGALAITDEGRNWLKEATLNS